MTDYFLLGPLVIKFEWITLAISFLGSFLIVKIMTKDDRNFQKQVIDILFNAILMIIIIFKFSIVLFRPSLLSNNLLGIVYFTGGTKGLLLGSITAIIYILVKSKKQKLWTLQFLQVIMVAIISTVIFYWIADFLLF